MLIYFIQTYLSYTKLSASNFKPEKSIMEQNDEVKHVTLMGVKCLLLITTNQIPTYHSFKVGLKYAKNLGECLVFTAKSAFK